MGLIGIKYGQRCINIASVNADNFKNYDTMVNIIGNIENINIDIPRIHETHNERDNSTIIGNYAIISGCNGEDISEENIYIENQTNAKEHVSPLQ